MDLQNQVVVTYLSTKCDENQFLALSFQHCFVNSMSTEVEVLTLTPIHIEKSEPVLDFQHFQLDR